MMIVIGLISYWLDNLKKIYWRNTTIWVKLWKAVPNKNESEFIPWSRVMSDCIQSDQWIQYVRYVLISNSHNVQCVQHINIYGIPSGVQCVLISTGHMSNVSDMSSVSFVHLDLVCLEYSLVSSVSLFLLSLSTVCPMRKMSSVSNEQNV